MTKFDNLTNSFSSKMSLNSKKQPETSHLDLDTVLQNDHGRKFFSMFLKEFNNSCDSLLTLYLICCCFQNHQRIEDRQRIRQILEKTYNACFVKNELTYLSADLKQKLGESLQKKTYNESIFNAVKSELKDLLETEYFPQFLDSAIYRDNVHLLPGHDEIETSEKLSDRHSTSLLSLNEDTKSLKKSTNKGSSNLFVMPNAPKPKATSSTSRLLKQSKSSSSSTSSVASMSTKSHSRTSKAPNAARNASKSSLSSLEPTGKLSKQLHHKSNTSINSLNYPPNPYHVTSKAIPVSAQDSERQSVVSADDLHFKKPAVHSNRLPKLNRQIKENLIANKNAQLNMPEFKIDAASQPMKKPVEGKMQLPLAESNPEEFFNVLAKKMEAYITKKANSRHSASFSNGHKTNQSINVDTDQSFRDNFEKLSIPYESDIDAQLDDHLSRVYNGNELNNSKMSFVKVSSLSRTAKTDRSLNMSSHTLPNNSDSHSNRHHHFYKLTSTSKEVDIDDAHHNTHNRTEDIDIQLRKSSSSSVKGASRKSSGQSHRHHHENYDSGVSIRSAASIERVNDWLNQSTQPENIEDIKEEVKKITKSPEKKQQETELKKEVSCDVKTTVAYYLPGEDLAYISTFNGKELTLSQFKHLITKKGQFKYFFKTKSDLLDEECVVYQEATDDSSSVPMFNNKVIAKIEKC